MARCSSRSARSSRPSRRWRTSARASAPAIEAVKARGKSDVGQKTMLDVLAPVHAELARGGADLAARFSRLPRSRGRGDRAAEGLARARLVSRRALDRAYGPRCALLGPDDHGDLQCPGRLSRMANVGIVIVSHSPKVAEGAADMVRQMVGDTVPVAYAGGNPDGGLGTDVDGHHGGHRPGLVGRRRRHPGRSRRRRDQQRDGDRDAAGRPAAHASSSATHRS